MILSLAISKFQSTRPRGARRMVDDICTYGRISFNPRARVGRDLSTALPNLYTFCFNPRARVGRDLSFLGLSILTKGFNPRARVGRDRVFNCCSTPVCVVSIHAPAWGATLNCLMS